MASINKLSIRGVRAFSPDDQEQVIEFYFPVTVIVGANGCGKTTIIESLKYAVTGSLPPGNKSGQAFVHDPKSIGQSAVKANIKLRFTNRAQQQMVVVRSMEVTQKKATMSFKALDGILRTTDAKTGEKVSMSHKCTELDRQIPMLLGVSKPILEHVVFCHQEDSSWPLMEGAVLKRRFDDIFDSTRYAKALKAIQDTRKEYQLKVKDLKAELEGLASHKHAAKGFREELARQTEELEDLEENVRALTDEMREVQEEIKRNEAIAEEVEEQKLIIEEKQTELTRQQSVLAAHKSMLQEDLTSKHSSRELKEMLRDFDAQMSAQIEKKRDLQRDHEAAENAIQQIRDNDKNLREQIGKLNAEKAAQEERLSRRLAKMDAFCETYGILLPTTQTQNMSFTQGSVADSITTTTGGASQETTVNISPQDIISFFKTVDDKEAELKQTLSSFRSDSQRRGDEIQEDLNDMSAKVKEAELELKKLEDEQTSATNEIENLNTQTGTQSTRVREGDIKDAKERMEKYIKERDKVSGDKDLKNIPSEIRNKEAAIDVLRREIEYDNQALAELRENSDAQNSITVLKEQAKTELENLKESVNDQSYLGHKYNVQVPTFPGDGADPSGNELVDRMQTFLDAVTDKNESALLDLEKAKDELVSKQRVVSEKSALLSHSKQNLASLRSKLDALGGDNGSVSKFQRTISAIRQYEQTSGVTPVLHDSNPQAVMAHLTSRLEDIEKTASGTIQPQVLVKVLESIYGMSAVKEGDDQRIQCPCCLRDFEGMHDFTKFRESIDRLKDIETSELLRANRQEVEKSSAAKAEYQRWRKVVSETMHDVMDWTRMSAEAKDTEVTITDIERDLKTCRNEVETLEDTTKDLQASTSDLRNLVEVAKRWTDDAGRLSRKKEEISQKKTDLELATGSIRGDARDLQTVENDLNRRQAEKEELSNKINELNRKMTKLNQKIADFSKQATECEKLYRTRQKTFDEEQSSTVRKNELQARLKVIGDEILNVKDRVRSWKAKERSKKGDRDRFRNSMNDELQSQSDNLRKFESEVNSLRQIQAEIDAYIESSKEEEFDRINAKLSTLSRKLEAKKTEREQIMPKLRSINKEIGDQETHKKLIEDNLKLIGYKDAIAKLEDEINQMLADVEKVDGFDTFEQALEDCQKKLGELNQKRSHHEGRRGAFAEQIRTLKRKLTTPEYKNIDERHRVVVIKYETTQIAVGDLEKYHTALDNALLRYHGIKIADINRIIRELWNLTYKGEDITTIEIVSGQDKGARKSYNYRVVMSKGGTKLDMRGRCSAGQRVLASIVIRLALAETFCVNCGCIALDEPTVNLDYNNKRGLAIALAQIIASRAQQSNFQLVVITHDEEFVTMMKTELASQSGFSMPEKYFQVRREEAADGKHYSKIDAIDWDELV